MLMKEKIQQEVLMAVQKAGIPASDSEIKKIQTEYPDAKMGDYSSNAALILSKSAKMAPKELAAKIVAELPEKDFEAVEVAGPGFINFKLKIMNLVKGGSGLRSEKEKILLEYFQPNIAKPLHIGHMRTAIIGDALKRMLEYIGAQVESDTHMGDWGTQFGYLIHAYKKHGDRDKVAKNPIEELNKLYVQVNLEAQNDKSIQEMAKAEFIKLEKGDEETRKIWKQFVDWSLEKFLKINDLLNILPFDHHWPESFYEDKMPEVVSKLKQNKLLVQSQGAWIVNLEDKGLGVAVIIKSDGGTTYLLRDLAAFLFVRNQGFSKHLYVVDNRQALHYKQLFAILGLIGEMKADEGLHISYGFMSFRGEVLSTRKGNMVLLEEVLSTAGEKAAKIIQEKNPNLKDKDQVVKAVSIAALKFFDLSHNRYSDIEFDWDQALDFEGKSGPYLQYTYARLASILRKEKKSVFSLAAQNDLSTTERRVLFLLSIFDEKVTDSLKDYLPNVFADYLYDLANNLNRFYHESPVISETDEQKKAFRLGIVSKAKESMKQGMDLLGITALEEM
jgi:arginyl-tRNA synthetase